MIKTLYPHQELALRKLANGKVLYGGVGSGKTKVAVEYYKLREAPRRVFVITTARKRDDFDWQREFYEVDIGPSTGPAVLGSAQGAVSERQPRLRRGSGAGLGEPRICLEGSELPVGSMGGLLRDENCDDWWDCTSRGEPCPDCRLSRSVAHVPHGDRGEASGSISDAATQSGGADRSGSAAVRVAPAHGTQGVHVGHGSSREGATQVRGVGAGRGSLAEDVSADGVARRDDHVESAYRNILDDGTTSAVSTRADTSIDGNDSGNVQSGIYPWVLTVDSWQNINKYAGVEDAFFIFDEQRLVGSGKWTKSFLRIARRNHWILLSATPGDTWLDYAPIFIANGFYKNITDFKRQHVVYNTFTKFPKVDRYIMQGILLQHRKALLVEMPVERHTNRHHIPVPLSFNHDLIREVVERRWHVYEDRPLLDVGEMFRIMRKVVNSDPSRLEMVYTLMQKHPRLIIFYNFDYELESLRSVSDTVFVAEWNGHKHEPVPDRESWVYLVQYTAGAEAWNCIATDAMVLYSQNYSWKTMEQAYGRIDRINTPYSDLWYYGFTSKAMIDQAIGRSLQAKKVFNVKHYKHMFRE